MDYAALKSEIQADPKGLGCAPLVAAGNDSGLAALLNATTGPGAGALTLAALAKNDFLKATAIVAIRLAVGVGADGATALTALTVAKWGAALSQARAADPGSGIDLTVIAALGDPVADNVLTAAELTALITRPGSRAEVLFGAGASVGQSDVSKALRGN